MNTYIYQADLLCGDCGDDTCDWLTEHGRAPTTPGDELSYDSDDYPKWAGSDGGGEADSPQCCGKCGRFLENALTTEGYAYLQELLADGAQVRARLADAEQAGQGAIQRSILALHEQMREFYGVTS